MEYRTLGRSGLKVSTLAMGTASFGGGLGPMGNTQLADARRQIDLCLDAGVNHYLTKSSFHDETLIHAVEDLIGEP